MFIQQAQQLKIYYPSKAKYKSKRCEYDNKDEDNSPKTLNDKNLHLKNSDN